jgi:hypothetical protein
VRDSVTRINFTERVKKAAEIFRKEFTGAYMALNAASLAMFGKELYDLLAANPETVMKLLRELTMDDETALNLLVKSMLKGLFNDPSSLKNAVEAFMNEDFN